jgi:beta-phosphoglucomutase
MTYSSRGRGINRFTIRSLLDLVNSKDLETSVAAPDSTCCLSKPPVARFIPRRESDPVRLRESPPKTGDGVSIMLRAILFDFNGVLVDDEPIHFDLFRRVLAEEGVTLSREDYYRDYLGLDDRGAFMAAFAHVEPPLTAVHLMRLIARKATYYQEQIRRDGYRFFPGAVEMVQAAIGRGWMLGVVSGALREEIEGALRQVGLRQHFKVVVAAEDVTRCKPDPEGYDRAIEALNTRAPLPERLLHGHEVLAVEDSPAGLRAAAAAGCVTLGVTHTAAREELTAADDVVDDLSVVSVEGLEALWVRAGQC